MRNGRFTMTVLARKTPFAVLKKYRNVPYAASVKVHKTGVTAWLTFEEWLTVNQKYYSPDDLQGIAAHWNSNGA